MKFFKNNFTFFQSFVFPQEKYHILSDKGGLLIYYKYYYIQFITGIIIL